MKKLLLFCLLASVPAFGQAYSSSVTQNSPGNYGRPVPYATVLVCGVTDTAVPCTTKVPTFTTQTLTTQCSSNAGSGVLTGAPTSGTNCNNPGIADINGNFTIYVAPGQYMICTYANNWLCQPQSIASGPTTTFNCVGALNGSIMATINPTTASCDPNMGTDFAGNGFSQSWKYLGPVNGFFGVIGGTSDPGTQAKFKLNTNEVRMLAPLTVPTPYYWRIPGTRCAVGQGWQMTGEATDANGDKVDTYGCASFSTAGGVQAQVNGTNLSNCTGGPPCSSPLLNFVAGTGIAITNTSGGNVQIASSASASQIANPIAPTLTVGGTPGASTVTYVVQLCEEGPACTKHTQTSTATVTTANATLSSSPITISAYADTIYGWRCANVYRTVGGPSQGLIANCTGKAVIDNGLAASAGSPTNTNTTALTPTMNPTSGGCDYPPGSPQGVDGLPCSPTAYDSEMTQTFGTPGDANDGIWTTTINASNFSAIAWTGGMLSMQSSNSTNGYQCIFKPFTSSTPYAFTELQYVTLGWNISVNGSQFGIVLRESSTGKMAGIELEQDDHQYRLLSSSFTSPTGTGTLTGTVTSSNITVGQSLTAVNPGSYRLSNDGTNIHFWYSDSGVTFHEMGTGSTVASLFTTAPNQVGFCTNAGTSNGLTLGEVDYLRKTQ